MTRLSIPTSIITILCLIGTNPAFSQVKSRENPRFGLDNQHPNSRLASDSSSSNRILQTVNLHTGQHDEYIEALQLQGRGGLSITLGLQYHGLVRSIATKQNYQAQASPYGLGFALQTSANVERIVVQHNNTTRIDDDSYFLITNGRSVPLIPKAPLSDEFVTADGTPWDIIRSTAIVPGESPLIVTGFALVKDDGIRYQFGDLTSVHTQWNSTQYLNRFGVLVSEGFCSTDDCAQPYPNEWYLKSISNTDETSSITFEYTRDSTLFASFPTSGESLWYTRATYLSEIRTSDGQYVQFNYADRLDKQARFDFSSTDLVVHEFYFSRRIDNIVQYSNKDIAIKQIIFEFDYLDVHKFSPFIVYKDALKKLLLTSFKIVSPDGQKAFPATEFYYDKDSSSVTIGSIKRVRYPTGLVKRLHYSEISSEANFTNLDTLVDSLERGVTDPNFRSTQSQNLLTYSNTYIPTDWPFNFAFWDGYWRIDSSFPASATYNWFPQQWNDNWFVYYDNDGVTAKFVVNRWMGGYWEITDIPDPSGMGSAQIFPGPDYFLAMMGNSIGDVQKVYLYKWRDGGWTGFELPNPIVGFDPSVKFAGNTFAYSLISGGTKLYYGHSSHQLNSVKVGAAPGDMGDADTSMFVVGPDYVAYLDTDGLHIQRYRFSSSSWWEIYDEGMPNPNIWMPSGLAIFPRGVIWNYRERGTVNTHTQTVLFTSVFDVVEVIDDNVLMTELGELTASNHAIINVPIFSDQSNLWTWEQGGWTNPFGVGISGELDNRTPLLLESTYAIDRRIQGTLDRVLEIGFYIGEGIWVRDTYEPLNGWAGSSNLFVFDHNTGGGSGRELYSFDPFHTGFETGGISNLTLLGDIGKPKASNVSSQGIAGNTISTLSSEFQGGDVFLNAYKYIDRKYANKARLMVVDSVLLYKSFVDKDPIVQTYNYGGGLIDQSGHAPRFAAATVSLPRFASSTEPIVYVNSMMYNDIPSSGFYDPSVYDGAIFPELSDPATYGIADGGYRLDGITYMTLSFRIDAPTDTFFFNDTTWFHHSLVQTPELLYNVFRIQLDSVRERADGIEAFHDFGYDNVSGRRVFERSYFGNNYWRIRQTLYAHQIDDDATQILSDNALNLPALIKTNFSADNIVANYDLKDQISIDYEKHGQWRAKKQERLLNPGLPDETLVTDFDIFDWDAYGNVVTSNDALGVPTTFIYDSDSIRVIAEAHNILNDESIYIDFENGPIGNIDILHVDSVLVIDTGVFTGDSCYFLWGYEGVDVWGGYGSIDAVNGDWPDDSLYISVWAKGSFPGLVYVRELGVGSGEFSQAFSIVPVVDQWTHFDTVIAVGFLPQIYTKDRIEVRLIRYGSHLGNTAISTDYIMYDDLRVIPLRTQIETKTFDKQAGVPSSVSSTNNVPVNYHYDALLRDSSVTDYLGMPITSASYFFSTEGAPIFYFSEITDHSPGSEFQTDTIFIQSDQTVDYVLNATSQSGTVQSIIRRQFTGGFQQDLALATNGNVMVREGQLTLEPDDTLVYFAKVWENSAGFASASVTRQEPANVAPTPNYIKLTNYRDDDDSTEVVHFYSALGQNIQTRRYVSIEGADTTTLVAGFEYDARGRLSKLYKPYYDDATGNSVFDYDDFTSFETELNAYYDASGPGPDCAGFAYTETEYDLSPISRTTKVFYSGSFRINPLIYEYGLYGDTLQNLDGNVIYDANTLRRVHASDPDGNTTVTLLDVFNNTVAIIQDSVVTGIRADSRFYPDFLGLDTLEVQPEGVQITRNYNNFGWLNSEHSNDFGLREIVYDVLGRRRFTRDESLRSIANEPFLYTKYDQHGRPVEAGFVELGVGFSRSNANMLDFPNVETHDVYQIYEYDRGLFARGELLEVQYTLNDIFETQSPSWERYSYNPYRKIIKKEQQVYTIDGLLSNPKITLAEYDRQDVITKLTYPNGKYVTYTYDGIYRVSSVQDGSGDLGMTFDYWPTHYVRTKILGYFGGEFEIPKQTIDYQYNERDWLETINDGTVSTGPFQDRYSLELKYTQNAYTGLAGEYPAGYLNGNVASYQLQFATSPSIVLYTQQLAYDPLNRISAEDYTVAGGPSVPPTTVYTYDRNGKIVTYTEDFGSGPQPVTYTSETTSNRLLSVSGGQLDGASFSHTPNGAVKLYTQDTLKYDHSERLRIRSHPEAYGPNTLRYIYNHRGARIAKINTSYFQSFCPDPACPDTGFPPPPPLGFSAFGVPGGDPCPPIICTLSTTTYTGFYYFAGDLLSEYNGQSGGVLKANYVYANGEIVAKFKQTSGDVRYYLTDHLGSVVGTIDETGALQNHTLYRPFGERHDETIVDEERFSYTEQEREDEHDHDWTYHGARYYDSRLRQFLRTDPASQNNPGWSPYSYARCNPVRFLDPDGAAEFDFRIRVFIPFSSVLGFFGDNRGYSYGEGTSRVEINFTIETDPAVSNDVFVSGPDATLGTSIATFATPRGPSLFFIGEGTPASNYLFDENEFSYKSSRTNGNDGNNATVGIQLNAGNVLTETVFLGLGPDIYLNFTISILPQADGSTIIAIQGIHTEFPAFEVYVTPEGGDPVFVWGVTPNSPFEIVFGLQWFEFFGFKDEIDFLLLLDTK